MEQRIRARGVVTHRLSEGSPQRHLRFGDTELRLQRPDPFLHRSLGGGRNCGRITGDEYDKKARELKERQTEITLRIEQHQKGESDYRTTLETLISLASRASELFDRSKTEQKRELLAFVFSNLRLRGKTLEFSLRSRFDLMVNRADHSSWLAFLNIVRTERFDQVLALANLFPKFAIAA
jgi:hypothetical protein